MDKLLEVLEKLYTNTNWQMEGNYFSNGELIDEAIDLCNELLITNQGGCNLENIFELKKNGYRVYAGERDGFGWLTGCVQKKGDTRILVYG